MSFLVFLIYALIMVPVWVYALRYMYYGDERKGKSPDKFSTGGWAVFAAFIWPLFVLGWIVELLIDFALRKPPKDIVEQRNDRTEKTLGLGEDDDLEPQ